MGAYVNEILLIIILIAINAFFAAAEIAILSVREIRVRNLAEEGNRAAKAVQRLTENSSRMLATIQIGITLAGFLASASAAVGLSAGLGDWLASLPGLASAGRSLAVVIVTLIISYFTLVLGELAPKRLALQKAEAVALRVARLIEWLARVAGPVTAFLTWSTNLAVRLLGGNPYEQDDEVTEEELQAFVAESGTLDEGEKDLIHSVFQFGDSSVAQAMVPRMDVIAVRDDSSIIDTITLMSQTGYSRLPVYEGSIDNIIGIVNLKDLLPRLLESRLEGELHQIATAPVYILEQKKAIDAFHEMQEQRAHMAVVIDEYGGTAGIVTLEDLVEMVVGDIRDEYDQDEVDEIRIVGTGEAVAVGHAIVGEINDELGWDLPEQDDYETIGGLVSYYLNRIPEAGDVVQVNGINIVVEKMDRRRVERVRLSRE
ncbi:MAG: hemolysin family protein [Bacillota bacterium]